MMDLERPFSRTTRTWTARLLGWFTLLAFFGISTIVGGFYIDYHPPFTRIGPGEANLWMSSAFLLLPSTCMLGYGYHASIQRGIDWLRAQIAAMTGRERKIAVACLSVFALVSARLCNRFILLEYPVTDDEWAVKFGGEVLAQGKLMADLPFSKDAFPVLFSFSDGNRITSLDWLGGQLAWMIATLTHTGNWVFAIAAALPVPCIAWLLAKRIAPTWGLVGVALFMMSPMAFALSMSSHAHVLSRGFLALTLALYWLARERRSGAVSFALGFALGCAIICRPFEVCFILAPLFLVETWQVLLHGSRAERMRWLCFVLGVAIPLAAFFAHAYALTGSFTPARHHPKANGAPTYEQSYWVRFGSNSGYNALRLAMWFAGPLGVLLFMAGVLTDRFTALLSLGVLAVLLLGLFHDNYGVHVVGPIHYSECVVPLTLVAVHGLARINRAWRSTRFTKDLPLVLSATWLSIGLGIFNALDAYALHDSSRMQQIVYDRIESKIPEYERPAVLLVPMFAGIWLNISTFTGRGTWVFEWRRPHPDFSDDILILHDFTADAVASVRKAFPRRHYYTLATVGNDVRVVRLP
jgi:hypothetical protein